MLFYIVMSDRSYQNDINNQKDDINNFISKKINMLKKRVYYKDVTNSLIQK